MFRVLVVFGVEAFLFAGDGILEVVDPVAGEEPESLFHGSLS